MKYKGGGVFKLKFISLLGIFVLVTLALLFQKDERIEALFEQMGADYLSVLYLKVMVNLNPDNSELRLLLAKQLENTGKHAEAKENLEPLIRQQGETALQARILSLQIDKSIYFGVQHAEAPGTQSLSLLQEQVSLLGKELIPLGLLPEVIDLSLSLERPDIAAMLYERMAALDRSNRFEWLKQAGRWHIASGHPLRAGNLFNDEFSNSNDPLLSADYALLSIKAMRAADQSALALDRIHHYLEKIPSQRELWDAAVSLALETNQVKQAASWGERRLRLNPEDTDLLNQQIDLALAAGDLSSGLRHAQRLVALQPGNRAGRKRLLQIAEWAGKLRLALEQSVWLARKTHDEQALEKSIQLAGWLYLDEVIIEMLTLRSADRALTRVEINKLSHSFVKTATVKDAIDFFKNYLTQYPDDYSAWEALAMAQAHNGLYKDAIATWQHIHDEYDTSLNPIINQARLLHRLNKPGQALVLLSGYQNKATQNDLEYWENLANLAWTVDDTDKAMMAYRHSWTHQKASTITAERLIQLVREKNPQEALSIAEAAYHRFNQPRWLLLAMDVSIQARYWEELNRLLKFAQSKPGQFNNLEMYWLIQAQQAAHFRKFKSATDYYKHALQINPESITAKSGLLWALMEHNNRTLLSRYIHRWRQDAWGNAQLQGIFATALVKMGRYNDALVWMARKTRSSPDDDLWLLSYSDLLEKIGRVDSALKIRNHVVVELGKKLAQLKRDSGNRAEHVLQSEYFRLIREIKGAPEEFDALKKYLARGMGDDSVRELLVASYLSQENYDAARFHLLKIYASHQKVPPWQQFAVALNANNQNEIEHLLVKYHDELAPQDRIEALKKLGRIDQALQEIDNMAESN